MFKEIFKFSIILLFILSIVSTTIYIASAETVGQRSQTVDLVTVLPSAFSLDYRLDTQQSWISLSPRDGISLSRFTNSTPSEISSAFPADSSGSRVCKLSEYSYPSLTSYKYLKYTESYNLPLYQFPFDNSLPVTIYYVTTLRFYRTYSNSFDNDSVITCYLHIGDNSYPGVGLLTAQVNEANSDYYNVRVVYKFDLVVNNLSSSDRLFTFETLFDLDFSPALEGSQIGNRLFIGTNLFPFLVTTDYDSNSAFSSATYDAIVGGVLPTLDNISSLADDILAEQQRLTAIASAQASAISTLPAQIGAQMSGALHEEAQAEYEFGLTQGATEASRAAAALPVGGVAEAGTALSQITGAISGNQRTAVWRMPRVYLPKIDGVMDELELIPEQDIALTDFFDRLPPSIIMIIRAICSITLGVYIIKELISFVRKLRGGVDNG